MLGIDDGLEAQVETILADVWSFLGLDEVQLPGESEPIGSPSVHVYTRLSGTDADVGLTIQCHQRVARELAGAMLESEASEVEPQDVSDAMGEIANIVGGNLKALAEDLTLGFAVVQEVDEEVVAKGQLLCRTTSYPAGLQVLVQVTLMPTATGRAHLAAQAS